MGQMKRVAAGLAALREKHEHYRHLERKAFTEALWCCGMGWACYLFAGLAREEGREVMAFLLLATCAGLLAVGFLHLRALWSSRRLTREARKFLREVDMDGGPW